MLGLSMTPARGNGHAAIYRGLVRELTLRGHEVLFLERDPSALAANRDLPAPPYGRTALYAGVEDLRERFARDIKAADVVLVGSRVPDGIAIGQWVQQIARCFVFYDIDTPLTLAAIDRRECDYLTAELMAGYDLYLSTTGGPLLRRIERYYGSPRARSLYCAIDPTEYTPRDMVRTWDLGFLGTYSDDRRPSIEALLLEPARQMPEGRFAVAGPDFPEDLSWPENVTRLEHVAADQHPEFYSAQRFTLNITRREMLSAGYSPSVRLFEAAACATPVISDYWSGLDTIFVPGSEMLVASSTADIVRYLQTTRESERQRMGRRARQRVLAQHTVGHRAAELEQHLREILSIDRSAARVAT